MSDKAIETIGDVAILLRDWHGIDADEVNRAGGGRYHCWRCAHGTRRGRVVVAVRHPGVIRPAFALFFCLPNLRH